MEKSSAKKLSVTLRSDLLERMDEYASANGMSRSGLLAIATTQYLNAVDAMPSVNKLLNAMAAVTESTLKGEMTPTEAEAKMKAIQFSYEALTEKKNGG